MSLVDDINVKLKQAMLARDQFRAGVFRDLKSAILYEEVAKGKREEGLSDEEIETVIMREVKKRNDAIEAYEGAGDKERANKEAAERDILQEFLPEPLSDDELQTIVDGIMGQGEFSGMKDMGKAIQAVKNEVGNRTEGAKIAGLVKKALGN